MLPTKITDTYVRKPLYIEAVQVTAENFVDVARWCFGEVMNKDGTPADYSKPADPDNQYIKVRVTNPKNTKQTQASVGDWILFTEAPRGYKVYTTKAFHNSFVKIEDEDENQDEDENPDHPFVAPEDVVED